MMYRVNSLTISIVLALSVVLLARSGSAQTTKIICIGSGGALSVREDKCVSGETKASMSNLPQKGAKGAIGATGPGAIKGLRLEVFSDTQFPLFKHRAYSFSFCSDGEVLIAGGCRCYTQTGIYCNSGTSSTSPLPVDPATTAREGWRCEFTSTNSIETGLYTAYSLCADAG